MDFNPKGIRIGFLDDVSGWISAYWCNYHDDYHTRTSDEDDKQFNDYKAENQVPTHWMEIPPCVGKNVDTGEKQCIIPDVSNLVCDYREKYNACLPGCGTDTCKYHPNNKTEPQTQFNFISII